MDSAGKFRVSELMEEPIDSPNTPLDLESFYFKPISKLKKFFLFHAKKIIYLIMPGLILLLTYQTHKYILLKDKADISFKTSESFDKKLNLIDSQGLVLKALKELQVSKISSNSSGDLLLEGISFSRANDLIEKFQQRLIEKTAETIELKIKYYESGIESLKAELNKIKPFTHNDFYGQKMKSDIQVYIDLSQHINHLQHEYFQKTLKIEEIARHNTVDVFQLRNKEIISPFAQELEMLLRSAIDYNDPKIQAKLEQLKVEHAKYVEDYLSKQLDEIELEEVSPARRVLLDEEKNLRNLWFDLQKANGMFAQIKKTMETNNFYIIKEKEIKHLLESFDLMLQNLNQLMIAKYEPIELFKRVQILERNPFEISNQTAFAGLVYLCLFSVALIIFYKRFDSMPIINDQHDLVKEIKKPIDFIVSQNFVKKLHDNQNEEQAIWFETLRQKATFFNRIDQKCGVILVNTAVPGLGIFWAKIIASLKINVCHLYRSYQTNLKESNLSIHSPLVFGISEFLKNKVKLSEVIYATNFKHLYLSPLEENQKLPTELVAHEKQSALNGKFDYLLVECHPNQIEKCQKYFQNNVEYQINCIVEGQSHYADLKCSSNENKNIHQVHMYIAQ